MATPTPEQLAQWRKEFESVCLGALEIVKLSNSTYADSRTEAVWQWHKQTKTEMLDVMKLAKFGAMVMASRLLMNHDYGTIDRAIESGLLSDEGTDGFVLRDITYTANIEATIEQLLKE